MPCQETVSKSRPPGFVSRRAIGRQSGKGVPLFQLLDLFGHVISSRMQKNTTSIRKEPCRGQDRRGFATLRSLAGAGALGEVASSRELPPSLLGTWCRSRRRLAGGVSRNATRQCLGTPAAHADRSVLLLEVPERGGVRWLQLGREQQVPSGGGASCAHSSGRRGPLPPDQRPLSRLGGGSHGCVSLEDSSGADASVAQSSPSGPV